MSPYRGRWPKPPRRTGGILAASGPGTVLPGAWVVGVLEHGVHAIPRPRELLFTAAGERLAALPERDRLVEAQAAGLQRLHDLGQLVTRLLVAERAHIVSGRGGVGHGC